jgi:hypothetical protein
MSVISLVVIVAAACTPLRRGGPGDPVLMVTNQSNDQADIYALGSGGEPVRIGTIFAGRTEPLRVPAAVTGAAHRVNVIARIFATSRVAASGPFTLEPGDTMTVTLSSDAKLLSVLPR